MFRKFLLFLAAAIMITGCGRENETVTVTSAPAMQTLQSTLPRSEPAAAPDDLETLRHGGSDFAFSLYRRIAENGKNLFFSPYSIASAFTMLYAGAVGETKTQMQNIFHFLPDDTRHHETYNALDRTVFDGEGNLTSANSIWLQKDMVVYPGFLDTLALNYGADAKTVDFAANPETARQAINGWVSDKTYDVIPEALGEGSVDAATRLMLVNAIHFMANWKKPFPDSSSYQWDFYLRDGTTSKVPMMFQSNTFFYHRGSIFSAISLPYDDNRHRMVVLLPDSGSFETVEADLNREYLAQILAQMGSWEVELYMPKFEMTTDYSLIQNLASLGMTDPFDSQRADFSGISDTPLYISRVIHKAVIKINERTTEAAAVTVIDLGPTANDTGNSLPFASMKIDRPFFFFILDDNDTILFMGKVEKP
jgi:serpin B